MEKTFFLMGGAVGALILWQFAGSFGLGLYALGAIGLYFFLMR